MYVKLDYVYLSGPISVCFIVISTFIESVTVLFVSETRGR